MAMQDIQGQTLSAESRAVFKVPYVDWAAVIGGATIVVALIVLFAGFGAALGLSAISAEQGDTSYPLVGVLIAALWIGISTVAAYAMGGYIAGRMRRPAELTDMEETKIRDGLNGLIVWAVGTVLSALIASSVLSSTVSATGQVAAASVDAVGNAASGVVEGVAAGAAGASKDLIDYTTSTLLRPASVEPTATNTFGIVENAQAILAHVASTGEISETEETYLVGATAARSGLSPTESRARVTAAVDAAKAMKAEAQKLADDAEATARAAAESARIGAILTAFLLTATALVAGAASYAAAVKGGRHRDNGGLYGGFAYHR